MKRNQITITIDRIEFKQIMRVYMAGEHSSTDHGHEAVVECTLTDDSGIPKKRMFPLTREELKALQLFKEKVETRLEAEN